MDKWEKIVTLQRELIRHKNGCTIDYLIEKMERCNRSTVYRIKELAEIVFGVTIIRDSKSKKFRFDLSKGELTELPGCGSKKQSWRHWCAFSMQSQAFRRDTWMSF